MPDAHLAAALSSAATEEELFAEVLAIAAEHGIEVSPARLKEVVRATRIKWMERWLPFNRSGWVPVQFRHNFESPLVEWSYPGDTPLVDS